MGPLVMTRRTRRRYQPPRLHSENSFKSGRLQDFGVLLEVLLPSLLLGAIGGYFYGGEGASLGMLIGAALGFAWAFRSIRGRRRG